MAHLHGRCSSLAAVASRGRAGLAEQQQVHGQHRGIFWVEAGVAITVSGVMLKIFYMFAGRGRDFEEEP